MTTAKSAAPRDVPAKRTATLAIVSNDAAREHANTAMGELYSTQGLALGAALLAASAKISDPDERKLRSQSVRLARGAVGACDLATRALDEGNGSQESLDQALQFISLATGQLNAATALLDATQASQTKDACLYAWDLYGMALARLEAAGRAVAIAHDRAQAAA